MFAINLWLGYFWKDIKRNFFLYLILFVLLIFTVWLWYGLPLLFFTEFFPDAKIILFHLFLGFLFSFIFFNINLKVSKKLSNGTTKNYLKLILRLQVITIFIMSFFAFIVNYIIWGVV